MNELDILKKMNDLEKSSNFLNIQINLWHDGVEKKQYISDKSRIDAQIEDLKTQIIQIEDKQFSQRAKQAIIDQIMIYINETKGKHPRLLLLRDQGTVLKNELFASIARDIRLHIKGTIFGINIPIDLYYTIDENDGINIEQLNAFLANEIETIRNIEVVNFISLRNYYDGFENRIIEKFIV